MSTLQTKRLTHGDRELAKKMFATMVEVFEEPATHLSERYVDRLLEREDFWAIAAFVGDEIVGGLTAHTLPMTRSASSEILIYDIAVRADHRRQGIGRALIAALREAAATAEISDIFVPAAEDDAHAIDFYRSLGWASAPVTIFTFSGNER